jgi:hypothetical protein
MTILNEYKQRFEKTRGNVGILAGMSQIVTSCVSDIEPSLPSFQIQKSESDGETIDSGFPSRLKIPKRIKWSNWNICVVWGAKGTTRTLAELRRSITSLVNSADLDNDRFHKEHGVLLFDSPLGMDSCDFSSESTAAQIQCPSSSALSGGRPIPEI